MKKFYFLFLILINIYNAFAQNEIKELTITGITIPNTEGSTISVFLFHEVEGPAFAYGSPADYTGGHVLWPTIHNGSLTNLKLYNTTMIGIDGPWDGKMEMYVVLSFSSTSYITKNPVSFNENETFLDFSEFKIFNY